MAVDDFMAPLATAARTTFLTARAAARHMIPRRSGVILAFGGPGDRSGPMRDYYLGGTQVAFDAIETVRRQLAVELGPHGVRVVTLARPVGGGERAPPEQRLPLDHPDDRLAALEPLGATRAPLRSRHDGGDRQHQRRRARRLVEIR